MSYDYHLAVLVQQLRAMLFVIAFLLFISTTCSILSKATTTTATTSTTTIIGVVALTTTSVSKVVGRKNKNDKLPVATSSYMGFNHYLSQRLQSTTAHRRVSIYQRASSSITSDSTTPNNESDDSNSNSNTNTNNSNQNPWLGNDMYQRIFYRFSHGSDVTIHDAIIIEERCRFMVDPQRPNYMIPTGPRTIILRNGMGLDFENGEIGNDFYSINVVSGAVTTSTTTTSSSSSTSTNKNADSTHNGAGNDPAVQSAIACAIYLSCNPDLCQGRMLELSADTGLGSLLGCIGAGYVVQNKNIDNANTSTANMTEDIVDDILTIGKDRKGPFPPDLELLSITDVNEGQLLKIMNNLRASGLKSGYKVNLDVLDWRTRKVQPRMNRGTSSSSAAQTWEYRTIVASDIAISYPETKELARAVANRVEPITPYIYQSKTTTLPCFVHVCPDDRDDVTYLRRILEKGYRMSVSNKFLKLEKLIFHLQKLPCGQPESDLDDIELELKDSKEIKYQALVAQHHPDYTGGGSGEMFFPIETGEYEATGGSTFLEKETGSSPW